MSESMIPGAVLRCADVPLAALPAVRGVPADGVAEALLPGTFIRSEFISTLGAQ